MAAPDDRRKLRHCFVTGSSGSGKTTWVMREPLISEAPLRLLWDPDGSHANGPRPAAVIESFRRYAIAVQRGLNSGRRMNLAYAGQQTEGDFGRWCALVWRLAQDPRVPPLTAIIEEVGHVTRPDRARGDHFAMLTRGRKYGLGLVSIAQRPQEIDKTTIGNAAIVVCGALERRADRGIMAAELDIEAEQIAELAGLNRSGKRLHLWIRVSGRPAQRISIPVPQARRRTVQA